MWVETYRPRTLDEVVGNDQTRTLLKKLLKAESMPHLLLHGKAGVSKTTCALAMSREMFPDPEDWKHMVLEFNSSIETGIDVIRNQVKDFIDTKALFSSDERRSKRKKIVLFDEADALSQVAQAALRRVLEEFHDHACFIFTTNHLNKIIEPLQSRCVRFWFGPLPEEQVIKRLRYIAEKETCLVTDPFLQTVSFACEGDMRRAIHMMQCVSQAFDRKLTVTHLKQWNHQLSDDETEAMVKTCVEAKSCANAITYVNQLRTTHHVSLSELIRSTHALLMKKGVATSRIQMVPFLVALCDLEYRLSLGANENVQVCAFVGFFFLYRKTEQFGVGGK